MMVLRQTQLHFKNFENRAVQEALPQCLLVTYRGQSMFDKAPGNIFYCVSQDFNN